MMLSKLKINCSIKSNNPIVDARKRFEQKRNIVLKDNFNKIANIASSEIKDLKGFIDELDQLHRKEFDKLVNKTPEIIEADEIDNIFKEE
jgi:hypothetical protein